MNKKFKIIMLYVFCYSLLVLISVIFYFLLLKVDEVLASYILLIPVLGIFIFGGMFIELNYEREVKPVSYTHLTLPTILLV